MTAPGSVISHYRLLEVLGAGAMGEVWLADDLQLPRQVAVKLLPRHQSAETAAVERLLREAHAAASVDHPGVVTVYEAGIAEERPYLVMQRVEGDTLETRLRGGPLEPAEAVAIVSQIADALSEVHALGIVHRDLKPANVVLTTRGPKLLDFGLASMKVALDQTQSITTLSGTPIYMSPEQMRGLATDNRSDLWSLGCVLYEALTGVRPFEGATLAECAQKILTYDPPPPGERRSGVARELDFIVAKLLRKDPALRYARAEDLLADLRSLGAAHAPGAPAKGALPAVAVIPFEVMSSDPEDAYVASGLAEDLMVDLTRLEGLRVAARAEVIAYRERNVPARTLGRELGVDYLVQGSVRRAGQRVRISAQLVRAADGHTLWADRYDRTLDDLFEVQAEVSKRIVEALQVTLHPGEREMLERKPTQSREAYDLYLQARGLLDEQDRGANRRAEALLRAALEADPRFAQARGLLAYTHASRLLAWWGGNEDARIALDEAQEALALEPDLTEALLAVAMVHRFHGDAGALLPALDRILALDPENEDANLWAAWSYMSLGQPERALPMLERTAARPNAGYRLWAFLDQCYDQMGRAADSSRAEQVAFEKSLEELRRRPNNVHARSLLGTRLVNKGDAAAGIAQVEMALRLAPDDNRIRYNAACTYARAGRKERALDLLREGVRELPTYVADWPKHDPDLASLWDDPEFIRMFGKAEKG